MKALLIVDMCKGFVDRKTVAGKCSLFMPAAFSLVPKINTLMSYMDKDKWFVVHINDSHPKDDPEFSRFPFHCLSGSEESETADGFNYQRLFVHTLEKTTFSAFHYTALKKILDGYDVREVIIVGVAMDICVFFTAADAAGLGFDVTIPLDCVEPIDIARGKGCMLMLREMYGVKLVRSEDAVPKI